MADLMYVATISGSKFPKAPIAARGRQSSPLARAIADYEHETSFDAAEDQVRDQVQEVIQAAYWAEQDNDELEAAKLWNRIAVSWDSIGESGRAIRARARSEKNIKRAKAAREALKKRYGSTYTYSDGGFTYDVDGFLICRNDQNEWLPRQPPKGGIVFS